MQEESQTTVKQSYSDLRSIYIPASAIGHVNPGPVTVLIEDDDEFSVDGSLNAHGLLSGMAKLYSKLPLEIGSTITFAVQEAGTIVIKAPKPPLGGTEPVPTEATTVFERNHLRHIHLEIFRAENLESWEPETETDVYLAFGVLQEYTDFQYCCGASKALLNRLDASYDESAKPDAILIDRKTDQYLFAEWKKYSGDYKINHSPEDVDVLVCWHDNELDRAKLPPRVVALQSIAKLAVAAKLAGE